MNGDKVDDVGDMTGDRPTLDEVLDRAGGRSGGSLSLEEAVAALRSDRAAH